MEINLLIADITCTLASLSIEHHCASATNKASATMYDDSIATKTNKYSNNIATIVDSKETIQQEQIDIDITVSEIFLTYALNLQEDMSPLSHCVILDYDITTATKETFTISQIINDIFFSLATKSCELTYNHDMGVNNVNVDNDVTTSEQILLHTLCCAENKNKEIINHAIESYCVNKNNKRKENDLAALNEPFYDNDVKHGYDYDYSNDNNSTRFSIFSWFRRK